MTNNPFYDSCFRLFFSSYSINSNLENDETYICEIKAADFIITDETILSEFCAFLQKRDRYTLSIIFGAAESIIFNSAATDINIFKAELIKEYKHQIGEEIHATFTIIKKKQCDKITIYDLDTFIENLKNQTIAESFYMFSRILSNSNFVNFQVLNLAEEFNSNSLYFLRISNEITRNKIDNRNKLLENINSLTHFSGVVDINLTPFDFNLNSTSTSNIEIKDLFQRYSIILSIIYLVDISTLKSNIVEFKLNGYKSIKASLNAKSFLLVNTIEYYDIFDWVFKGGNLNDKIGLARNILSLHLNENDHVSINGSAFNAIQSSYKIYEKQNIKQYIEIRNKISDQLLEFNNRASKIVESFASGFQKSSLALITFYISVIAIKILGKREDNLLNSEITILSLVFLCGCTIYHLISRWEVTQQKKRFINSYENLKMRYLDLLEKEDISRILNNDKDFNEDLEFIKGKLLRYTIMWWSIIILLLIATVYLYFLFNIESSDLIILKLLFTLESF